MGIRGLFSYIQNYVDKALEWHKLHNCNLIVDGSNLAYDLYNHCKGKNVAFGGDYDKYSATVEDFFKKLLLCDVRPYVVMDGGYPLKRQKFKTVHERISKQLYTCNRVNPDNQDALPIFPLMGRSVFVNVIQKIGITVLQCDFEADDEIVVIAKKLNAFVLSNDSDFYLFDVPFILLNSVNLKCLQKEVTKTETYNFIPCYIFNAETFAKITKVPNSLIPVLAPVLGNDVLQPRFLSDFYVHISVLQPKSTKMTDRHKLIMSVLRWLATQPPDPNEVLNKIKLLCDEVSKQNVASLDDALQSYYPTSSTLEPWIGCHSSKCPLHKIRKVAYMTDITSKINFASKSFLPVNVEKNLKCKCDERKETSLIHGSYLPGWFIKAYRLHLVPPIVANLLNKNYFFTIPQIEYQERKSVYIRLESIVRGVRGLLWSSLAESLKRKKNLENPSFFRGLLKNEFKGESFDLDWERVAPSNLIDRKCIDNIEEKDSLNEVEIEAGSHLDNEISETRKTDCEHSSDECSEADDEIGHSITNESEDDDSNEDDLNKNDKTMFYGDSEEDNLEQTYQNLTNDAEENKNIDCNGNENDNVEKIHNERNMKRSDRKTGEVGRSEDINIEMFKKKKKIPLVRWYLRNFNVLCAKKLYPEKISKYKNYPTLFDMEQLTVVDRKKIFSKICEMEITFEEELPQNIEFILVIICYWYNKYSGHIHYSTLLSVLMCVLMFCFIDGKYGRKRSKLAFEKISENSKKIKLLNNDNTTDELSSKTIMSILNSLTKEECLLANLSLYQFHDADPADTRKNYDRCVVHSFSEYQACFYFLSTLNSLLCFPYPSISIESYWSGTFCYNVRKCFYKNNNINTVLTSIFGNNTRVIYLYTRLCTIVQQFIDIPFCGETIADIPKEKMERLLAQNKKKLGLKSASQLGISTKRKRVNKMKKIPEKEANDVDTATEDELALLIGNKFSSLLII